jgi:D-aminopeptidase
MWSAFALATVLATSPVVAQTGGARPTIRDLGRTPGVLSPGPLNAITDVAGVRVGQVTLRSGDSIRTGVTAFLPHGGDLFRDKVPAGLSVANGFGKLAGATQIRELGEIETPSS